MLGGTARVMFPYGIEGKDNWEQCRCLAVGSGPAPEFSAVLLSGVGSGDNLMFSGNCWTHCPCTHSAQLVVFPGIVLILNFFFFLEHLMPRTY